MDINRLPTEILSLVLAHLRTPELPWPSDVRHVTNARLVCREWNRLATPHLFRSLHIGYHGASISPSDTLLDVPEVDSAVQRVTILDVPVPSMQHRDGWWIHGYDKVPCRELAECAGRVAQLPNLRELDIRAHQWCAADKRPPPVFSDRWPSPGPPSEDEKSLLAFFSALRHRAAQMPHATPIRSLSLTNPQDMPLAELVESEPFTEFAAQIDSLHLLVTEEFLGTVDHSVFAPLAGRREYELHLQEKLLPPLSGQLATLTLAFFERWGLLPAYFNPCHLEFPRLRTLTLAEFVIGHDDHLDWVLAQTSLTTLRLHRCYIASHLRLRLGDVQYWRLRTDDWEEKPRGSYGFVNNNHAVYTYPGTWASVFQRIGTRLPNLTDFRLENDKPRFWFKAHGMDGARLSNRRYIVCDVGNSRSPWVETDQDGEMEFGNNDPEPVMLDYNGRSWDVKMSLNRAAETEQADGMALEALLKTIRARW